MKLPRLLQDPNDEHALAALRRYYGTGDGTETFTGARFDTWDSTGTRAADHDRFTADDLVAVTFLSVNVSAPAAIRLLDTQAQEFSELLSAVGPDKDLAEGPSRPWPDDWAGWRLHEALLALPDVGPTTASKLLARKLPRLRPIYDSVVERVIGTNSVWESLRQLLTSDREVHDRLVLLGEKAKLPKEVSALRVFDVVTWMEGKYGAETF